MVYKGDIIELPAPSREVLDLDDEDLEDSEMAAPCNTPRIVFPLEFTAPPEQPAHRVHDDDPDVLEAVEEQPAVDLCAIGNGPQPIDANGE